MKKQIDVYVNDQGQPKHLAVLNEHSLEKSRYRSLCGTDTINLEVKKVSPQDVKTGCKDCDEQLKMWLEVQS